MLVGAVWVGQGTGILRGSSFMVGDPFWALAGVVLIGIGTALAGVMVSRRGA